MSWSCNKVYYKCLQELLCKIATVKIMIVFTVFVSTLIKSSHELKNSVAQARSEPRTFELVVRCSIYCLSHDPFLRIQFLLVPKIGSCEHVENDLPTHAIFSSDTLLERRKASTNFA